jgi:hypothetical protein
MAKRTTRRVFFISVPRIRKHGTAGQEQATVSDGSATVQPLDATPRRRGKRISWWRGGGKTKRKWTVVSQALFSGTYSACFWCIFQQSAKFFKSVVSNPSANQRVLDSLKIRRPREFASIFTTTKR